MIKLYSKKFVYLNTHNIIANILIIIIIHVFNFFILLKTQNIIICLESSLKK